MKTETAGGVDAINRRTAQLVTQRLDWADAKVLPNVLLPLEPWYRAPLADTLMNPSNSDWAWFVGFLAKRVPGLDFDGPADGDWENLFTHFEAEILSRRSGLKTPPAHAAETQLSGVV